MIYSIHPESVLALQANTEINFKCRLCSTYIYISMNIYIYIYTQLFLITEISFNSIVSLTIDLFLYALFTPLYFP